MTALEYVTNHPRSFGHLLESLSDLIALCMKDASSVRIAIFVPHRNQAINMITEIQHKLYIINAESPADILGDSAKVTLNGNVLLFFDPLTDVSFIQNEEVDAIYFQNA